MSVLQSIEIRILSLDHFEAVYDLHCAIVAGLEDQDHLRPLSKDFMLRQFGAGIVFGAFAGDALVGYGILEIEHEKEENAERFLPVNANYAAQLAGAGVRSDYREAHLQHQLIVHRISHGQTMGFQHFYATASPTNLRARAHLMNTGFCIIGRRALYGSLERHILYRPPIHPAFAEDAEFIAHGDSLRQFDAMERGLWGMRMDADGIYFSKPQLVDIAEE